MNRQTRTRIRIKSINHPNSVAVLSPPRTDISPINPARVQPIPLLVRKTPDHLDSEVRCNIPNLTSLPTHHLPRGLLILTPRLRPKSPNKGIGIRLRKRVRREGKVLRCLSSKVGWAMVVEVAVAAAAGVGAGGVGSRRG